MKLKPFVYLGIIYIIISFLLRCVFIFHPITTTEFGVLDVVKMFSLGLLSDIFVFIIASAILYIYLLFLSNQKYERPWGQIILSIFVGLFLYIYLVPNNIARQYGGVVPEIVLSFLGLKTFLFGMMFFFPKRRVQFRNVLYFITIFLYVSVIVFNAVSEYFFYNEFGVRYNFIAVDYLIYTNEVIGNILESYPVLPLFSGVFIVSLALTIWVYLKTRKGLLDLPNIFIKGLSLVAYGILAAASVFALSKIKLNSSNIFQNEISANGLVKFYDAFNNKVLDFDVFYPTMDTQKALNEELGRLHTDKLPRMIKSDSAEITKNVVLISVESLSAEFMAMYGNKDNITPFLDSLSQHSLVFTNLYATGNRTVRGLEALTLCIPPTAGESIVKRKDNKNKFTTGSVFKSKGYNVKYLYGGYSYFDNMKDFFGGNGYEIVDRDNFKPEEIVFANIWGVSDEDMAKKAIETMNEDAKKGKPFFHHWMTVSNHRPFTYPEGRIDIPGTAKSRDGGVKYTDYSIKKFFQMAEKQPWYKNTVFVIVSDHCASSAGKTELPMDKYRIPGMIFSPEFVKPQKFNTLMSQIDVMPTLFGLLNFTYQSKFIGQDVFSENYVPRAYIATYQDLGYVKDDKLTIISPIKNIKQYQLKETPNKEQKSGINIFYEEHLLKDKEVDKNITNQTISTYQTTSYWLKTNQLNIK